MPADSVGVAARRIGCHSWQVSQNTDLVMLRSAPTIGQPGMMWLHFRITSPTMAGTQTFARARGLREIPGFASVGVVVVCVGRDTDTTWRDEPDVDRV